MNELQTSTSMFVFTDHSQENSLFRSFTKQSRPFTLPKDQILDLSQLDAFADDKTDVTQKLKSVSIRIENIVGKGENARYQHFLL